MRLVECLFVVLLVCLGCSSAPLSPCPEVFEYSLGPEGAPVGKVRVPMRLVQLPVTLKIHLAIHAALKTKYAGLLMLTEQPILALGNILGGRIKTVNYTVRFPLPEPLPYVREITVNNKTLCVGQYFHVNSVYGGVTTNIHLQHTFPAPPYSFNDNVNKGNAKELHRVLNDEPASTENEPSCGNTGMTFHNGQLVGMEDEQWPWLTAIFIKDDFGFRFHCAGNLISKRHVITAAHCIKNQINTEWTNNNFYVYLGVTNLETVDIDGSQVRDVTKIQIHPEYNDVSYAADIAVLSIQEATLSKKVSPVCLWNGGASLKPLIGHMGTVVGWGLGDSKPKSRSKPEIFQLPIVGHAECLRSRKEFLYITSDRTLCAGLRNGTGPCTGDSGSGLAILTYTNKNVLGWSLRGLISLSLLDPEKESCDLNEFIVFTDIARFTKWIIQVTLHD